MNLNINEMTAAAEAVLFAVGEPLELIRLCTAMGTDEETMIQVLENLRAKYEEEKSGICLLRMEDKYQLCSQKKYADIIRTVMDVKRNAPLSQAAFEVLAIIAYNQPVTKSFIEQVRGVDCSAVLGTLSQKLLIEEKGRLDLPGRPLLYGTTPEFLRCFCLSSLEELPGIADGNQLTFAENAENVEKADEIVFTEEKNQTDSSEKVDESQILG